MTTRVNKERQESYRRSGLWSDRTLLDCWKDAVKKWSGREYVTDSLGRRLTYGALDRQAEVLAEIGRASCRERV